MSSFTRFANLVVATRFQKRRQHRPVILVCALSLRDCLLSTTSAPPTPPRDPRVQTQSVANACYPAPQRRHYGRVPPVRGSHERHAATVCHCHWRPCFEKCHQHSLVTMRCSND